MAEAGVPNLVTGAWFGLFAPKGTPPEIVARLNKIVTDALANPTCVASSRNRARNR
jgi:tripartite-type tricarboxylate transporter receptor subunit TctC